MMPLLGKFNFRLLKVTIRAALSGENSATKVVNKLKLIFIKIAQARGGPGFLWFFVYFLTKAEAPKTTRLLHHKLTIIYFHLKFIFSSLPGSLQHFQSDLNRCKPFLTKIVPMQAMSQSTNNVYQSILKNTEDKDAIDASELTRRINLFNDKFAATLLSIKDFETR